MSWDPRREQAGGLSDPREQGSSGMGQTYGAPDGGYDDYYPQPAEHAPAPAQPQYSPDGRFVWDGHQWVPNVQATVPPYGQMRVHPKNPVAAMFASLVVPGVGSMMSGEAGAGVAILIGWLFCLALCFVVIGFLLTPAMWVFAVVHARKAAHRWNAAHGALI